MSNKYSTIQQHEPLRVPSGWTAEEKRLIAQLEEILDDLYRRFNRLRLEDMGSELRETIVSAAGNTTAIQQAANAITLVAKRVGEIEDGTVPVGAVENTAVEVKPAGVNIKTGGTFTVESGNFELDEEGNVAIKNASVSGNLSTGGYNVLTGNDIIISSNQPTDLHPGLMWVRPVGNMTLLYRRTIWEQTSFAEFNAGIDLVCQSIPAETIGNPTYRLTFPYRCTTTSSLKDRTLIVTLSSGTKSITVTEKLKQFSDGNVHDFTFDQSFTSDQWLGTANTIRMTMVITADSDPYKYHKVDTGVIALTCTAITSGSSGFTSAEVKVFQ